MNHCQDTQAQYSPFLDIGNGLQLLLAGPLLSFPGSAGLSFGRGQGLPTRLGMSLCRHMVAAQVVPVILLGIIVEDMQGP